MPPGPPPSPSPPGSSSNVEVVFNGTGIHTITGPTPFISINRTINRNQAGLAEHLATSISLDGKIVKTSGATSGISAVFSGISGLKELFTKCDNGILDIKCNGGLLAQFSGVKVTSFNADRSEDNWVFTSDYSIQLEMTEPVGPKQLMVTNTSDSWTIEPIEEFLYLTWDTGVQKKPEGTENSRIATLGGSNFQFTNMPQYRISHRVSAVGLSSSGIPSAPQNNNTTCPSGNDPDKNYLNAKKWVEDRLKFPFAGSGAYILPGGAQSAALPIGSKIFLCNHLRSIEFSLSEGSYQVVDNWLGLPSGVRYIEDFTMESSTSENYTTTVRVQGTVKGLETETTGLLSTGLTPNTTGEILLDYGASCGTGSLASSTGAVGSSPQPPATTGTIKCYKYQNALDGWIDDIKPTLYTRACSLVNSRDRITNYVNPAVGNPPPPPINPIFAKQTLLNVIPVSTTEGHSPLNGTVSYSYEYNNKFNVISGTISQNINITDEAPTDVLAETFVVGRPLGPIIQRMGKTSAKKSVTVEVVVVPPSSLNHYVQTDNNCPLWTGGYVYQTIDIVIEGLKPFGDRQVTAIWPQTRTNVQGNVYLNSDTRNWNPAEGRYSRSVSWTYQRCNIGNWMDH